MSFIDFGKREINFKFVVLGEGRDRSGSWMEALYNRAPPDGRDKLVSLEGTKGGVHFFSYLPRGVDPVKGFSVRLHIFGGSGGDIKGATLQLLLKGADGVIFLEGSEPPEKGLTKALEDDGIPWLSVPKTGLDVGLKSLLGKVLENF